MKNMRMLFLYLSTISTGVIFANQKGFESIDWDSYPSRLTKDRKGDNIIHTIVGKCACMTEEENNTAIRMLEEKYKGEQGKVFSKNGKGLTAKEIATEKWKKNNNHSHVCEWWIVYLDDIENQLKNNHVEDVLIQKPSLHKLLLLVADGAWKDPRNTIIYLQALNRLQEKYTKDTDGAKNTLQDQHGNKINNVQN